MFDLQKLTMGEVTQLEELSGLSMSAIAQEDSPKGRYLTVMAYLAAKREDPSFTINQAEALTLAEALKLLGAEDTDAV